MASDSEAPSSSKNIGYMPTWLQDRIKKMGSESSDMNLYGSSPPGNSCFTDFVKPPLGVLRQRQSSPDLTTYDSSITTAASMFLPKSTHVTPMTSPENSPNIKRRNKGLNLSDSEQEGSLSRQNWKLQGLFVPNSHISTAVQNSNKLNQITEDDASPPIAIPVNRPTQTRKKRTTITKYEINAFAPTSM